MLYEHVESCLCALVSLPDVTPGTVKLITEFAYTGVLPVTTDNVQELFIAADRFGISGIMQACSDFMEKQISPQNCISIWGFTNFYYNPQLMKALLFMLNHFEAVVTTSDEFLMLSANELIKIIESDRLIVKQERMVYEAILCWINFAPDHRKEYISLLLSKVSKGQLLKCL
ncbi:kelch-like protein 10 [Simochromis diagramma]|uniref:kelch-like protein 10 n=1 Tax=Simochromis diagramma TaxID=43689 RepID=UPI001A7E4EEB|nr:kelch-like protein 10 [Simochromis diagramma]